MKHVLVLSMLLVLIGCSKETPADQATPNPVEQTHPAPIAVEQGDLSFADYRVRDDLRLVRELSHQDTDASYILHEYAVSSPLSEIDSWLRSETARLGGTILERDTYNLETGANLDYMIEFASNGGTRKISTFVHTYPNKQHLIVEETVYPPSMEVNLMDEDHALVIFTPMGDGTTKEVFKGSYPHKHTSVFLYQFYSDAFVKELVEKGMFKNEKTREELPFKVGYYDTEGNEIDPFSIQEDDPREMIFGVNLQTDFLPQTDSEKEHLLVNWAKTLLLGDKAYSRAFDGTEQVNFLLQGSLLQSYTLSGLSE